MKKILFYYDKAEESLLAISFLFTTILIFIQVFCRTVLNNSLSWSEELARYIFIWQCWLGLSLAERDGTHIRIELLKNKLPAKAKTFLEYIVLILTFATAVFLAYQGIKVVSFFASAGSVSPALHIPMCLIYLSLPVSCAVFCVRIVIRFVGIVRGKIEVL